MISNALEARQQQPVSSKLALKRLQQTRKHLPQQAAAVAAERLAQLEEGFASEMPLLCAITSVECKPASRLRLVAGGFTRLDNCRQWPAMAGLSPREHTSGTRIRGKVRSTKLSGGLIRGECFRCSFSAEKTNAAYAVRFDRLVTRGKHKKLALIAGCNEPLK